MDIKALERKRMKHGALLLNTYNIVGYLFERVVVSFLTLCARHQVIRK
jgi:hypothetical protein